MSLLPDQPFLTKDFSSTGGGIDFLGLRYVNLHLVGNFLIPEINNVTRDMGMFFIGAWIPWKFKTLCAENEGKGFTPKNYQTFREKAETALSQAMKISPCTEQHGQARNKVGSTQQCILPCELTFKNAKRSEQNSLYAAAIYGPSLRYLNLIKTYRTLAQDGIALDITQCADNDETDMILQTMDKALQKASGYNKLASLGTDVFSEEEIVELGMHGLDPSFYRDTSFNEIHNCFRIKLLPEDPEDSGYTRTLTTDLILETLKQKSDIDAIEMRNIWYTGHFGDGTPLTLESEDLKTICSYWALFMSRQHQRYAIELFLWCFETALKDGCNSIDTIVEYWAEKSDNDFIHSKKTLRNIIDELAGSLKKADDLDTSKEWNQQILSGSENFEYVDAPQDDNAPMHGLKMLAGWYLRVLSWQENDDLKQHWSFGGSDRMSIGWFIKWLQQRQEESVEALLKDIFTDLVFAQHTRIALSRFDGKSQRLRFVLGDNGIEPTVSAIKNLGQVGLPWMPDRLDALIGLLSDCGVLEINESGNLIIA